MFLVGDSLPELHTKVSLLLTLPGGRRITLPARVVHVIDAREATRLGFAPGFGVKFEHLDAPARELVEELVAWARQTERDEYAAYVERARWLEAAEAMRPTLSTLPAPPSSPLKTDTGTEAETRAHATRLLVMPENPRVPTVVSEQPPTTRMRGIRSELRASRGVAPRPASTSPMAPTAAGSRPPRSAPAEGPELSYDLPNTARLRAARRQSARPARRDSQPPLGAAGQLIAQVEAAYAAGDLTEASRHVRLLAAMTLDDPELKAHADELKRKVLRAAAVDMEKQATREEKSGHWELAAQAWLRVAEGRPHDSAPLLRAALAQLQTPIDPRVAVETAKRAVELAPDDAQAHRTLAQAYVAADMQASARHALDAAAHCAPTVDATRDSKPARLLQRLLGRTDER